MNRPVLTAAQMRAAEETAIAAGTPVETLMERAGAAAAEAAWRFAGPLPTLVLCGPGNNGGDGYVVARHLAEKGVRVRVAALGEPKAGPAAAARAAWRGPVGSITDAGPAPLLVDALFGTGLARPLDEALAQRLGALAKAARVRVAIDLPSGAATDDGVLLSPVPRFDLTVTFATLKPSHLLQPAASAMGRIVVADIGVEAQSGLTALGRPRLEPPGPADHKYSRGYAAVVAGPMSGAASLCAAGALKAGAGYVRLIADARPEGLPQAVVCGPELDALEDPRIGAVVAGPGLGTDAQAAHRLDRLLEAGAPLVLDADALTLLSRSGADRLRRLASPPVLTPHHGEFERLFPGFAGSKVERARAAAAQAGGVIVYKGADTVVAEPGGRAAIAPTPSHWLATAGTGDVLAGVIAAMRARGFEPFEAACAAVWLHSRAASLAGPGLVADDLPGHLPAALGEGL